MAAPKKSPLIEVMVGPPPKGKPGPAKGKKAPPKKAPPLGGAAPIFGPPAKGKNPFAKKGK